MMRYWILGVLWLGGCAGAPPDGGGEDAKLESQLSTDDDAANDNAADDDSADDDSADDDALSDTEFASEFIPGTDSDVGGGSGHGDEAGGDVAPEPGTDGPELVIGVGGQPWQAPGEGVLVVWCHASVLACPAVEPAPSGGQFVVVQQSLETGEFERARATSESGVAIAGGAGTSASGAGDGQPGSGVGSDDDGQPGSGAPSSGGVAAVALPVDVGGSLPPLPGTCVAITFTSGPGTGVGAGGNVTAPAPGVPVTAPSPEGASGAGASAASPVAGASGAATQPALLPALPPAGGCIGVSFPAPGYPGLPGEPPQAGGEVVEPAPTPPGGCLSVAFASNDASGIAFTAPVPDGSPVPATPAAPPQVCAVQVPQPGVPAGHEAPVPATPRPSRAGGHPAPASEQPTPADAAPEGDEPADEVR